MEEAFQRLRESPPSAPPYPTQVDASRSTGGGGEKEDTDTDKHEVEGCGQRDERKTLYFCLSLSLSPKRILSIQSRSDRYWKVEEDGEISGQSVTR